MVEPDKTTVSDNTENGAHNMVKLTIDNCEVVVPEHTTILDAAKSVGIQIPTLCYLRDLNEIGGCRVCVVEVEGCDQLVAACNNYVLDGMVVHTNSPKAREARRTNVQLLLSQHDSQCTSCVRSGNCNLQTIANDLGIFYLPYQRHLAGEGWDFDFPIIRENDKCIKCMRCIKVCERAGPRDLGPDQPHHAYSRGYPRARADRQDRLCRVRPVHYALPDGRTARARRYRDRVRRHRRSR